MFFNSRSSITVFKNLVIIIVVSLSTNSNICVSSRLVVVDCFISSLWIIASCLFFFFWGMANNFFIGCQAMHFTSLDAGYFCIPLSILGLYSGMQLSDWETV